MTASPVRRTAQVRRVQRHRQPVRLTLDAPGVAGRASAGQFVSIGVEGSGSLLRRPYFLSGAAGDLVEVDVHVVGRGSRWLSERVPGDALDVIGPLGRPFPLAGPNQRCLLVGDASSGTLRYLTSALHRHRAAVASLPGGGGRADALRLERLLETRPSTVYAAGPRPLLAAVSAAASRRRVPCRVAVTELMACGGLGLCWSCVVPVDDDGPTYVRTCADGPVLDGARVRWDEAAGEPG